MPHGTVNFDPDSPFLAQNVAIRRGLEGPQLVLEWEKPATVPLGMEIVVVRKLYEFPNSPFDGEVVFTGAADDGYVADLDLEPCKCYYYAIFSHDPFLDVWTFAPSTQASDLAIPTGYFANKLFNMLPNVYVLGDKLLDQDAIARGDAIYPLEKTFDPTHHEWFNIHENTDPSKEPKKRGPLSRFTKGLAVELDIVKGLADCFPNIFDVDESCCGNLPAMGSLLGLDVNQEFSCARQRDEIKEQVAILKVKGTKTAIQARGALITGLETIVHEWCGNVLISNRIDRTSLRFPNPGFGDRYLLPGDDTSYTPGGEIGFLRFSVFFKLLCDSCLTDTVVHKINRVMPPEFPVCRIGDFIFIDCTFEEVYDRLRLQETHWDEIDDDVEDDTELENRTNWLYSNRLDDSVYPPQFGPSAVLGNSRNLSNSARAVSANAWGVMEGWWDEYITPARVSRAVVNHAHVNDGAGWTP